MGSTDFGPEHRFTRAGLPEISGQQNVKVTARENTGQNTKDTHTPSTRNEIIFPDPAGNRTRSAGLEGSDPTNHATATDFNSYWRNFFFRKNCDDRNITRDDRTAHGILVW